MHALVRDWRAAPLGEVDQALCELAAKLTRYAGPTTSEDLRPLRALGLGDRAIHDAIQVIAYFNYITRIADGLGVEPEEFIQPWGTP